MADLVSRKLSSATKAVVVAFTNDPDRMKMCEEERASLAAALRAVADQGEIFLDAYDNPVEAITVEDLLTLAKELEAS